MMRFGDKFTGSVEEHRELWGRYRHHLARCGFTLASPVYRYFAGEVFHDRPIEFGSVDLAGHRIELVRVNSDALNDVASPLPASASPARAEPRDFMTTVPVSR